MTIFSQTEFNNFIIKNQVVKIFTDQVRLKSGQFSHASLNWRNVTNDPFLIDQATDYLIDFCKTQNIMPDCFLGVPEGATKTGLISTYKLAKSSPEFAQGSHFLPMGRGSPKNHGEPSDRHFIGFPQDKRVVVIEDITTTGGAFLAFIDTLFASGVNVVAAVAMTNRMADENALSTIFEKRYEGKCPYYMMTSLYSLIETMAESQTLSEPELLLLQNELKSKAPIAA